MVLRQAKRFKIKNYKNKMIKSYLENLGSSFGRPAWNDGFGPHRAAPPPRHRAK